MVVRALRARPVAAIAIAGLVASAMTASVLGPLLVRALAQSTVRSAVAEASDRQTVRVATYLDTADQTGTGVNDVRVVFTSADPRAAAGAAPEGASPDASAHPLWRPLVVSAQSDSNLRWSGGPKGTSTTSRISSAGVGCAGYAVVTGRCPKALGEVLVSSRDAKAAATPASSQLVVVLPDASRVRWTVVGTYDPTRTEPALVTRAGTPQATYASVTGDSLVVSEAQLERLAVAVNVVGSLRLARELDLRDDADVRALLAAVKGAALGQQRQLLVDSPLVTVLEDSARQTRAAGVLVTVTATQAFLLALLALAAVMTRVARSRAPEWAVGRLRGLRPRQWFRAVFPETLLPVLLGLVVGGLAAVVAARAVVGGQLVAGVPLEPWRSPVLLSAGACVAGSLLAVVAASVPSLRRPLADQLRARSEAAVDGPLVVAVQVLVITVAALAVYQLVTGGVLSSEGPQLGLAAPAVLAVALAVVATRVAVQVVRWTTARPPRGMAGLVVGRHVARAPSALVPAVVVAVGVSLAVFATQVPVLSQRNQSLRADATVGAATVLHVRVPAGRSLLDLVRAADPSGRSAMAVLERAASADGATSRLVAVDASRLAAVSSWRTEWAGTPDVARVLVAPRPGAKGPGAGIELRGTALRLTVASANVVPAVEDPETAPPHPSLGLVVETGQHWVGVPLGPIETAGGQLSAPIPCGEGCRLVGLTVTGDSETAYLASFVVAGVEVDGTAPPGALEALRGGAWSPRVGELTDPQPSSRMAVSTSSSGLYVRAEDDIGDQPVSLLAPDAIDPLPAVVGPRTQVQPFAGIPDAISGTGLDGQSQLLTQRGRAAILPRALGDGVLVDLAQASALSDPSTSQAQPEVWLAAGAPPDIVTRLTEAGVKIDRRELLSAERERLAHEPASLAAALGRAMALVALALALLTALAARAVDAPRRRADWAALRAAGVSTSRVRRLAQLEIATPPVLGAALGAVAGWVALRLTASRLPVVDLAVDGPPLDLRPAWPPLFAVLGLVVVLVVIGAAVGGWVETRVSPRRRR